MSRGTDPSSTWVHYTGEPISPVGSNRSDGHRVKLFEESVTFIAQLHPEDHDGMVPPLDRTWMIGVWPVDVYQIPIIIGISSGVLVLLLFIAVLIAWRCCHIQRLREKAFAINPEERTAVIHSPSTSSYPSVLAMSINSPSKPASPSLMVRNQLASNSCELVRLTMETPSNVSTATTAMTVDEDLQHQTTIERHSCEDMSLVGCGNYIAFDIPSFYEESFNSSSLSTSSNAVLDGSWSNCEGSLNELKTRSLPSWARNKPPVRPVQPVQPSGHPAIPSQKKETGHTVVPIIGVKRSHRGLRHDAAAAMALKKMKTATVQGNSDMLPGRVSLVGHNEAVIVFNERTAL